MKICAASWWKQVSDFFWYQTLLKGIKFIQVWIVVRRFSRHYHTLSWAGSCFTNQLSTIKAISVFYLVPKHFWCPKGVKSVAHDPALNILLAAIQLYLHDPAREQVNNICIFVLHEFYFHELYLYYVLLYKSNMTVTLVVGISATMCHSAEKIPAKEGCQYTRVST